MSVMLAPDWRPVRRPHQSARLLRRSAEFGGFDDVAGAVRDLLESWLPPNAGATDYLVRGVETILLHLLHRTPVTVVVTTRTAPGLHEYASVALLPHTTQPVLAPSLVCRAPAGERRRTPSGKDFHWGHLRQHDGHVVFWLSAT